MPEQEDDNKKGINIGLPEDVLYSSEQYIKLKKEIKSLSDLIETALTKFLKSEGFYPPVKEINLTKEQIERYRQLGILDENGLRNLWIKQEFRRRQVSGGKKKSKDIINELANELIMEPKAIEDIVYRKKERRKPPFILIEEIK